MSRADVERQAKLGFILSSARQLIATQGLESCTMEKIASGAEYTRRTLYSYFKSRDELLLRIHMEDLAARWERQRVALSEAEGGRARLRAWISAYTDYCREEPQAMRMERYWDFQGVDPERISPEVFRNFEALNDELADGLRDLFREGIADGSFRADLDVDMSISQFLYSLRAVTNRALSSAYSFAEFDPDAYFQHYVDALLRGIGNPGDPE